MIKSGLTASLSTQLTSTRSARRGALHDARRRLRIRSAAAESWKLCSRASDLHRASVVHLRREVGAIRRDLRGDRCVRTDRWVRVAWSRSCCIHRDCNSAGGFLAYNINISSSFLYTYYVSGVRRCVFGVCSLTKYSFNLSPMQFDDALTLCAALQTAHFRTPSHTRINTLSRYLRKAV